MTPDAAFVRPGPDWLPRLMVIDGCNVGRSACGLTREAVSCAGLLSVIRWLLLRDFDCVVFLPVVYNNVQNSNATQVQLLSKLEEVGLVTFTPARAGSGERRAFINYDDLYVTSLAERHGGCVLSGDKFKDILAQAQYSNFHDVIRNRVLDVKFLFLPYEIVHFGDDVLYRAAPELYIPENLQTRAQLISKKIHSCPSDPDFAKVAARRRLFVSQRRRSCLKICDDLFYELCEREGLRPMRMTTLPTHQIRHTSPIENITAHELALDPDDNVWHPDSIAPTFEATCRLYSEEVETHNTLIDTPLIDLFTPDDELTTSTSTLSGSSPGLSLCLDPFDIVERQLAGSVENTSPLTQPSLDIYDFSAPDPPVSTNHLALSFAHLQSSSNTSHGAPLISSLSEEDSSPIVEVATVQENNEERKKLEETLTCIFPRDVVLSVLTMNASNNVDFLAEQCVMLLSA